MAGMLTALGRSFSRLLLFADSTLLGWKSGAVSLMLLTLPADALPPLNLQDNSATRGGAGGGAGMWPFDTLEPSALGIYRRFSLTEAMLLAKSVGAGEGS